MITRTKQPWAPRSLAAAYDDLPTISGLPPVDRRAPDPATNVVGVLGLNSRLMMTLADSAIETAQTHGDTGPLDRLIRRLDRIGTVPSLAQLLRARRLLVSGDLPGALARLDLAVEVDDLLLRRLRPQICATRGLLLARIDPSAIDDGIALCRTGRQLGLRWWRRVTPADGGLARLLLWRAPRSDAPAADVREAGRLTRRRCRFWNLHGADDRLLRQEALAAGDALSGRDCVARRHRAWSRSIAAPASPAARARLAAAWAGWAVGTGVADLAAKAYERLVALIALDSAARYGAGVKQRVVAAAQEYAEEAGYWLTRTGRYREAVLALETGRAVGLTGAPVRDRDSVVERLRAAGRADLADAYRRATDGFAELERASSPWLRQAWDDLREVARQVGTATGTDPLAPDVNYDDITAEAGDGALVYIAAASAGGYALVVDAHHDPQFVDLPKLDRATVAAPVGAVRPGVTTPIRSPRSGPARDAPPVSEANEPVATGLRQLWADDIRDLLTVSAHGRIVTLVPVGRLRLLPLRAAGEPVSPGDPGTEWRHAG